MSQQVFDINTVGYDNEVLGNYFDFYVNNTFYLLAPEYYYSFYAIYLNRCLAVFDGWVNGFHNKASGLVPQRALQSISRGLTNKVFANGIDFSGTTADYEFAKKWAKTSRFYGALKKADLYACAGGTSLLKINRSGTKLFVTAHRIDTFFADIDASGEVVSVKVFIDIIHNTNPSGATSHFGLCEERYFDDEGKGRIKATVYRVDSNLQTSVQARQNHYAYEVKWENLPYSVKQYIKENYPSVQIGSPQYLPFPHSLGCQLWKFTDEIPQIPNTPFGQPIGDILFTENFQYDQMKYFEKNEVDLARARAIVPDEMWNKDDPANDDRALDQRFYQKVSSINSDSDKVTPIQFNLRGNDIRSQKENIYKDMAFKLNVSASSIASFLSEGAGSRTATEIVAEKTNTDTWLKSHININLPSANSLMKEIMYYYGKGEVEVVFKSENQSSYLEKLKTNSDVFSAGNMSAERFVKDTYSNLSKAEQDKEIEELKQSKADRKMLQQATMQSWNKGTKEKEENEENEELKNENV